MEIFKIIEPATPKVPIIISVPHAGTFIPQDIKSMMNPELSDKLDDTDWFIDKLYGFATNLGITIITANYSRWVVDLNRNPQNQPLYNDGRVITDVVTVTDFNGNQIYKDNYIPDSEEVSRRVELYHKPYHEKLDELLQQTKAEFGKVLLFDAHSIRKSVPGIRNEDFPDLILGDNDETSASPELIKTTIDSLQNKGYEFSHNHPFKGGYITRSFGKPEENIHALQLEMCKTNYMDASEMTYDEANAERIQMVLKEALLKLIETMKYI
ncbi:N-formylglutamate amidohydrolase [Epilithonimonas ginsengisoli]|uniref:N-formylglutamate amidohydrolase n=1 Tax=Epilithonimonas ginsengisoli TaxID=1245592 RepID=A0ABU4JN22_9FLAO|nr:MULTISPECIES: N-formylglutamate amidohydrolase [Chryseobacterium group]MBV6881967.1 N-formylglutamate amidohydrolase [Epilithonimonas sp. FP105]MDW8551065.1 N-formylglutamate amidohydrolase [Epilithonimonas ginsengisoli]OAH65340.1 N-formylglutamate deformylase [Chryseobacterium sp. FP211-J200]